MDWRRATHNHRPRNFHICTVCRHSHKERKGCLPVSYDYVVTQFHFIKLLQILSGFFLKTQSFSKDLFLRNESSQEAPPLPNLQYLFINQSHFSSQIYQPRTLSMVPILASCKNLVKFSSPTLEFSHILTKNLKSIRIYCHQNTLFHTIHWPNKYILIPSLYLNASPPPQP